MRSVLQLFCECDAVDETLSALVKGETPPMARVHDAMKDIADRIRIPWPGGAIKIKVGLIVVLPLLSFLLWLSTLLQSSVLAGCLALFAHASVFMDPLVLSDLELARTDFFLIYTVSGIFFFVMAHLQLAGKASARHFF